MVLFVSLFVATLEAVAQVFILIIIGHLLARWGILDRKSKSFSDVCTSFTDVTYCFD